MAEQGLKDKTVKGVGWSAIDNVAQYAVTFIVGIVLARLLSPDDYGLIGIIGIFTAICNALIDGGFGDALIRKKDICDNDYNTVFLVNLGMSLLLYVIIYFCAPFIAVFFNRSELVVLVRVASVGMIIGAMAIVPKNKLTKKIDFKTQTKITLITSISSGIVGIVLAFLGFGVWALVAQSLSSQLLRTILLWIYNKWLPKIAFSVASFKDLFGFGWKMMVSALLNSFWKELYQVVVGKFYNPGTLGQYTRAQGFSKLFSSNLTSVVQRVSYPVLSDVQDDKVRLVNAYRKIIKTTMFITVTCMLILGAVSEPLIYCLIGPKWSEAATYLPLICIVGSLYPLHAINLNMLQVQGRSDLFLGLEIVKKIISLGPLFVGAFVGIIPMLYASILTGVIGFFLNSYYSGKLLDYSSWAQIKDVAPSYLIAASAAIPVWALKYIPITNWVILPIQLIVGLVILYSICEHFKLEEYTETKNMLSVFFKKINFLNNDRK